jgi:hypothetical protein
MISCIYSDADEQIVMDDYEMIDDQDQLLEEDKMMAIEFANVHTFLFCFVYSCMNAFLNKKLYI